VAVLKITKRNVDAAAIPAKADAYYWDTELRGFGLRVTPKGVRSYVVQYRLPGRPAKRITIGIHGSPWTCEKARARAEDILISVKMGDDPSVVAKERRRAAVDLEFSKYVEAFGDNYLKREWGDSWAEAKRQLELHAVPALKGRPLPEIKKHEVTALIDTLRDRPALARNTHAVLRKMFAWALERGDLHTSPICAAPPAVKARKRVLTPDELVALWQVTFQLDRPFGQFIRLLMLTLQRRSEVAELPWSELSEMHATWRQDGERTKNGEDHLVPLTPMAVDVLNDLAGGNGWKRKGHVFTTTGTTPISGFSKLKLRIDRLMLPILQKMADERAEALDEQPEIVFLTPWRLHDIRRTGTTQMQALGIPIEVTEKVINHKSGETAGIRGVYNLHAYTDEKRRALQAWADFLARLVTEVEKGSNLIALPERVA